MKLANYLMSEKKWKEIVAELEKAGRVDWEKVEELLDGACGHCIEHNFNCKSCNLDKPTLCDEQCDWADEEGFNYLHKMCRGIYPRNKRKALSIARRILKAVLLDDPRTNKMEV